MSQSSDELIKREIINATLDTKTDLKLRIFPQSSRQDQFTFAKGGLTFGKNNVLYGSCDAVWYVNGNWTDGYDDRQINKIPVLALEGTDALSRGSSGNAQYQRFHHALGAVRNGVIGIYYFRPGMYKIQEDLYGMAVNASSIESGKYLIISDLEWLKKLVNSFGSREFDSLVDGVISDMSRKFNDAFQSRYGGDWNKFAQNRSSLITENQVIKHAARNYRNFTDSSQRAGHIAVGEMYLTKYLINKPSFIYLMPRLSRGEVRKLDIGKSTDKEWFLLRNEPGVEIITRDEIEGAPKKFYDLMQDISDKPLKGSYVKMYKDAMKICLNQISKNEWSINKEGFHG